MKSTLRRRIEVRNPRLEHALFINWRRDKVNAKWFVSSVNYATNLYRGKVADARDNLEALKVLANLGIPPYNHHPEGVE